MDRVDYLFMYLLSFMEFLTANLVAICGLALVIYGLRKYLKSEDKVVDN
jgi:hypothetical protein